MTKAQLVIATGCLLGLGGTVGDMFFNAPDYVVFALLISGIVVMLIGGRAARRDKIAAPPQPAGTRWRRFVLYLVLAAASAVVSFFGSQHSHPDFSLGLIVGICVFTFILCAAILYWQVFIRAK